MAISLGFGRRGWDRGGVRGVHSQAQHNVSKKRWYWAKKERTSPRRTIPVAYNLRHWKIT